MRITRIALASVGLLGWICAAAAFDAKEIGSFRIGGQALTLQGLPIKELVYTAGGPPTKMDPNGDFHTGQMYVQYIRLDQRQGALPAAAMAWRRAHRMHVGDKPDGQPGWQMYFINAGHDVYVSDAVERGRASWSRYPEVYTASRYSAPRRKRGKRSASGPTVLMPPTRWRGRRFPDKNFPLPPSTFSPCKACPAGSAMMPRRRRHTMRSSPRYAHA